MLKQLIDYILDLLNTARDTRANKEAIADLREHDEFFKRIAQRWSDLEPARLRM